MTEILTTLGYYAAAVIAVTLPPAVLYWFLIHPFAAFWRRLGKAATFTIVGAVCISAALGLWQLHEWFMAWHWGHHWPLIVLGLVLYVRGIFVERKIRRHLDFRILAGAPELDAENPGELLEEGPFARCRNPRYVNLWLSTLGVALILNYPVLYLELVGLIPAFHLLVRLEEKELAERFGSEYQRYLREVPRFLPRDGWLP